MAPRALRRVDKALSLAAQQGTAQLARSRAGLAYASGLAVGVASGACALLNVLAEAPEMGATPGLQVIPDRTRTAPSLCFWVAFRACRRPSKSGSQEGAADPADTHVHVVLLHWQQQGGTADSKAQPSSGQRELRGEPGSCVTSMLVATSTPSGPASRTLEVSHSS
ncbi:uncharacterized protein LOC144100628 [Amblyomma americanum]